MLNLLAEAEAELPALLALDGWESKDVDYHPPRVHRMYRQWRGDYRLSLHRIFPCKPGEPLWHPHPWPGAFRVHGSYEMRVGVLEQVVACLHLAPGTAYEMTSHGAYHSVRPLGEPSLTLMLTGSPWPAPSGASSMTFEPLAPEIQAKLIADFQKLYPIPAEACVNCGNTTYTEGDDSEALAIPRECVQCGAPESLRPEDLL